MVPHVIIYLSKVGNILKKIIALCQDLKANILQPPLPCYYKVQPASAGQGEHQHCAKGFTSLFL